jgi:exopolysaccharide production protein ExoQ
MPNYLILVLCTAFVFFLLRLERKESEDVSAAVWIPTIWILAISSKPMVVWFGAVGSNETGSPLDRILLTSLIVAGIVIITHRQLDWVDVLRQQGWLLALILYMLVSTLWSDITLISIRRWIREVLVLIMTLVIMSEANPHQAFKSLLRRSAFVLIPFSILLIKYYPALGVEYAKWSGDMMWTGVTLHKNSLGRLCVISAFSMLWTLHRRWRDKPRNSGYYQNLADISVLFVAVYLLKGAENSYSATSIGCFAIGIAVFLGLLWCRKLRIAVPQSVLLALVVLFIGFGASAPFMGGSNVAKFSSSLGRDETLTGRTEVWSDLVKAFNHQPLLGVGFGSFWTDARRRFYLVPHAHNGYLDILLELGLMGFVLTIVWLLSCARKLQNALMQNYEWASMAISLLAIMIIGNTTESSLNDLSEPMTSVLILASIIVTCRPIHTSYHVSYR